MSTFDRLYTVSGFNVISYAIQTADASYVEFSVSLFLLYRLRS